MVELSVRHEGSGAFALTLGESLRLLIDPILEASGRRRRRVRAVPKADFVLLTEEDPEGFEDALDVLEGGDAVLVADPVLCDEAARALRLGPERFMDLDAFERAGCKHVRITALPLDVPARRGGTWFGAVPGAETVVSTGARLMEQGPLRMAQGLPLVGDLGALFMQQTLQTGRRGGMGFLLEFTGGPSVLFLSTALSGRVDVELLEEIAEVAEVDVLVAGVEGESVEGLVWASRVLEPDTILLYRREDPYAQGQADRNLPIQRFIDALREDAPELEIAHLRAGDAWVTEVAAAIEGGGKGTKKASA